MRLALLGALALSLTLGATVAEEQGSDARSAPMFRAQSNLACGIPPIPPIGCKVGPCVCDQYGRNCKWTFICG